MNDPKADITRFSGPSFYTRVQFSKRMFEASFFILITIVDMTFKVGKFLYKVFYLFEDHDNRLKHCFYILLFLFYYFYSYK